MSQQLLAERVGSSVFQVNVVMDRVEGRYD